MANFRAFLLLAKPIWLNIGHAKGVTFIDVAHR